MKSEILKVTLSWKLRQVLIFVEILELDRLGGGVVLHNGWIPLPDKWIELIWEVKKYGEIKF